MKPELTSENTSSEKVQKLQNLPEELQSILATLPPDTLTAICPDQLHELLSLLQSPSSLSEQIPQGTNAEDLATVLAKIPHSQQTLHDEQADIARHLQQMFEAALPESSDLPLETVIALSNAELTSIPPALPDECEALLTLWASLPGEAAECTQAISTLHMAGFSKAAKLIQRLFVESTMMHNSQPYQSLQTDITKQKGAIETAAKHAQKGQDSRHAKNRARKEYALSLYKQKPYDNPSQARANHYPAIEAYANSIGHPFSSDYQGMKTVYSWFLAQQKNG